jgi:hypothetical protein
VKLLFSLKHQCYFVPNPTVVNFINHLYYVDLVSKKGISSARG